jgi:molecular chaperone HtpG
VPRWLRFLVGVVDSADLPLNVSREMLQNNPVVRKIGQGVVGKVLAELERRARDPDDYAKFWQAFGPVLKEGLVTDPEHRDRLMALMRFRTTARDGWSGLVQYVARMKEGQRAIYYVTGDDPRTLRALPQLEGYLRRGVEVLLLSDAVDDFWLQHVADHQGLPFRSVTRGADDLDTIRGLDPGPAAVPPPLGEFDGLVAFLRVTLDADVKDVRLSHRLEGSAACLVADERDLDIHLERLLRQHRQIDAVAKRILEINPRHALVRAMAEALRAPGGNDKVAEAAKLLVDQARLVAGDPVPDPIAFSRRLEAALQRGLPTR